MSKGRKTFTAGLDLKSEKRGTFEAVFATLGRAGLDFHGDLTEPGAFGEQAVVVEGFNHDMTLPVGKGRIFERENEAICAGEFFMNTAIGKEHYEVVKALGPQTEWSYTFRVLDSRPGRGEVKRHLLALEVMGVSPVTRGAGVGTGTRLIKRAAADPDRSLADYELSLRYEEILLEKAQAARDPDRMAQARRGNMSTEQMGREVERVARDVELELVKAMVEERSGPKSSSPKSSSPGTKTNLDALVEHVRQVHAGARDVYVEDVVRGALYQRMQNLRRLYPNRASELIWQMVNAWAAAEVGVTPRAAGYQPAAGAYVSYAGDF